FNRGSMPELIKDSETGFLVDDLNQACTAIAHLKTINRQNCRRHIEENFTVDLMVKRYIETYKAII
ncbi:MAG: glycosyltransferase family 4 protein, partial [Clostridia bacterium]|nr:glycosyltransferase family 4 protein [Clostridia bacterium]